MLNALILLTGPAEQGPLTAVLRRFNPRLTIHAIASADELAAIAPGDLARARLVAFVTSVLVPARTLNALGFGAYNFHPGPPHYPGWVPAHFAIYDKAGYFGATAHVMIERVDAGPIVGVELFPIPPDTGVQRLQELAFVAAAKLFWRLAPALAAQSESLAAFPVEWSGTKSTRRMHAAKCDIPAGISKTELDRRLEAFGADHFGVSPTITLHGHRFRYCGPEAAAEPKPGPAAAATQRVLEPA